MTPITPKEAVILRITMPFGRVYDLLNQAQDSNLAKESAYRLLSSGKNLADILGELETTNLKKEIRLAVIEIMTADL